MRGQGRVPTKGQTKSQQAETNLFLTLQTGQQCCLTTAFALSVSAYTNQSFASSRHHIQLPRVPEHSPRGSLRLNSFISAPIYTYKAIRFDMNANATNNMDQATVDIDESSKSAMTIMTLPRELRDSIYKDLVSTKYRFDAYKIKAGAPHFLKRPKVFKASGNSIAPAYHNPLVGLLRPGTYGEFLHKVRMIPYKYPYPPRPSLSILETSIQIRKEALNALYHKGTLLFVLNHPSHSFLSGPQSQDFIGQSQDIIEQSRDIIEQSQDIIEQSQDLIKHFNNVEILLDLVTMFKSSLDSRDEIRAISVTMVLIEKFAESAGTASTCTLSKYWRFDLDPFATSFFLYLADTAGKLRVFKTVVLRFRSQFMKVEVPAGLSTELAAKLSDADGWAVCRYREFLKNEVFWRMGPFEESFDSEGFYCVVFHPKHQVDGGGSSNSGSD